MTDAVLNRELDKTKISVFLGSTAALLGTILCSLNVVFDDTVETAEVGSKLISWNPEFFKLCTPQGRVFVLLHELWHVARLHTLRKEDRDHNIWNYACDYVINEALHKESIKCSPADLGGLQILLDARFYGKSEEDIYDILIKEADSLPQNGMSDLRNMPADGSDQIGIVIRAMEVATQSSAAGTIPGNITKYVAEYLNPVVPWQTLLQKFFQQGEEQISSWRRRNRRYQDVYLPSKINDNSQLKKLNYYLDVSGSVSPAEIIRFNSEFKYVKDTFCPEEMVQVLFNFDIVSETVIKQDQRLLDSGVTTGGGTSLVCVRDHINESKPTAAIIFSDLCCPPMQPLTNKIPVIWVVVNKAKPTVPFGTAIYIEP